MRRQALWVSVLAVCVALISAGGVWATGKQEAPKPGEKQLTFYMVTHSGTDDPYWAVLNQGAMDAAQTLGVKFVFTAPTKYSVQEMVNMLSSAIDAKPDGIAVAVTVPDAMTDTLQRAVKAGIPLLNFDSRDDRGIIPYLTYVGGDEHANGHYAVVEALKQFTPHRVIIGWHEPGHVAHETRANAVKEVLDQQHIPWVDLDITTDLATQLQAFTSAFQKYPDADAIYTMGPPGTIGAIKFIEQAGLTGKVKIFCQDFSPEILDAIQKGEVLTAASQQPYLQGVLSVVNLYTYVKYGQCPVGPVVTSVRMVTKDNVGQWIALAAEHRAG